VIGLDTNVLLRYLLKDDAAQAARAERDERFLVDGIVLCELVSVLEAGFGFSRSDIVAALERIAATAQFRSKATRPGGARRLSTPSRISQTVSSAGVTGAPGPRRP
jgi:hypothetical protein